MQTIQQKLPARRLLCYRHAESRHDPSSSVAHACIEIWQVVIERTLSNLVYAMQTG
jgi:hypothetical protein